MFRRQARDQPLRKERLTVLLFLFALQNAQGVLVVTNERFKEGREGVKVEVFVFLMGTPGNSKKSVSWELKEWPGKGRLFILTA